MLILTRKPGEKVTIECEGRKIDVIISKVKGKMVRVVFDADKDINIYRDNAINKFSKL